MSWKRPLKLEVAVYPSGSVVTVTPETGVPFRLSITTPVRSPVEK